MNKYKSEELLNHLKSDIEHLIAAAAHLHNADAIKLSYPPGEGRWSAVQCLEHLNSYNRYYLPSIQSAMQAAPKDQNAWFIPGFWGNYFTKKVMPGNVFEVKNKMKTAKAFNPTRAINVEKVFVEFDKHQVKLIELLDKAKNYDLEKIMVPISLTKVIKLKLGDIFRFVVAHEQRHMIQARNAIRAVGVSTDKFPVILEAMQL
jgi:uncharacterized damage-inducible protein DinB